MDWRAVAPIWLIRSEIPAEVDVKDLIVAATGRASLTGPGRLEQVTLTDYRARHSVQELVFDLRRD